MKVKKCTSNSLHVSNNPQHKIQNSTLSFTLVTHISTTDSSSNIANESHVKFISDIARLKEYFEIQTNRNLRATEIKKN